jgi:radical SAM-linked protein
MGAFRRLPVVSDDAALSSGSAGEPNAARAGSAKRKGPPVRRQTEEAIRYRFKFEKTGPSALLGHLDLVRALPRIMRRIGAPLAYSQGFHPKPEMSFSPALALGVPSLGEFADVKSCTSFEPSEILGEMNAAAAEGLSFVAGRKLGPIDPGITKVLSGARYLLVVARSVLAEQGGEPWLEGRIALFAESPELKIRREMNGLSKYVDVRSFVSSMRLGGEQAHAEVARAGLFGDLVVVEAHVKILGQGGVRVAEIIEALTGDAAIAHRAVRAELYAERDGRAVGALDLAALREPRTVTSAVSQQAG